MMDEKNTTKSLNYTRGVIPEDIDIRALFNAIWERKKLLLLITALGTLLTLGLTLFVNTTYTARSVILIEKEGMAYPNQDISSLPQAFSLDIGFILTEIEILKSRSLASKVVQRLNLTTDLEFNSALNKKTDILDTGIPQKEINTEETNNSDTVTNFLEFLRVTSIPGSLAVKVNFISEDANKTALITNTFVDEYIKQRLETKYKEQHKLTAWLDKRVEALKEQVLQSETKSEEYRALNNLAAGKHNLLSGEQITILNNQRILAQTRYLDLKAQISQHKKSGFTETKGTANSINSSLIKSLEIEKLVLETKVSELSNRYGPKHPVMIEKKDELSSIGNKIKQKISKSKSSLQNELNIAKTQLDDIKRTIADATGQNDIDNNAMIQLREFEREASTSRNILKSFLEKYKRSADKDTLQNSGVRIISYANIPTEPSSPDKTMLLTLGAFISLIIALITIFLSEKLFNKFRHPEDLETAFNIPCIGQIPYTRLGWGKDIINYILSKPSSPMIESVRNLRISLKNQKSKSGNTPKVISFMSSLKNEGKTTAAVLMSALSAKAGERVILIDANLRTPSVHTALKESNNQNLVGYLTDQKELSDVIHKDQETGMDVIFGASVPDNAFNLLSLNKLDTLIEALKQSYDLVIIDTPACAEASDARLVEQLSDTSVFCVKYNNTKDKTVKQSVKPFLNHANKGLSFLLTHVK